MKTLRLQNHVARRLALTPRRKRSVMSILWNRAHRRVRLVGVGGGCRGGRQAGMRNKRTFLVITKLVPEERWDGQ